MVAKQILRNGRDADSVLETSLTLEVDIHDFRELSGLRSSWDQNLLGSLKCRVRGETMTFDPPHQFLQSLPFFPRLLSSTLPFQLLPSIRM